MGESVGARRHGGDAIQRLEAAGILIEITGRQRNRLWRYEPYVRLFSPGEEGRKPQGKAQPLALLQSSDRFYEAYSTEEEAEKEEVLGRRLAE